MIQFHRPQLIVLVVSALMVSMVAPKASAQTSSIGKRHVPTQQVKPGSTTDPRLTPGGNPTLEKHSLTAVRVKPPKKYKVHDLVTIIIREQKLYESDAEIQTRRDFNVNSQLNAFFKPIDGGLGATTFKNGQPNVDFRNKTLVRNLSDNEREDRFTTRITAQIVDIKPNGNLLLEARAKLTFDEEISVMTLVGIARSADITADNTVLSTQMADKNISVKHEGSVRDGSRRGWATKLLDWLNPI